MSKVECCFSINVNLVETSHSGLSLFDYFLGYNLIFKSVNHLFIILTVKTDLTLYQKVIVLWVTETWWFLLSFFLTLDMNFVISSIKRTLWRPKVTKNRSSTSDISQNTDKVHTWSSARVLHLVLIRHLQIIKSSIVRYLFAQIVFQRRVYRLIMHDRLVTFWLINNKSWRWELCILETIFYYIIL